MVQAATSQEYYYGTGKRKTSIAKVRIYLDDNGPFIVNGKTIEEYFDYKPWRDIIVEPFRTSDTVNRFRVVVKVLGGGVHSQARLSAMA